MNARKPTAPWFSDLVKESLKLEKRITKLNYFLGHDNSMITDVSADELALMRDQLYHMSEYLRLLKGRITMHADQL